jgi:superfamily II DNA or RNA helicase
MGRWNGTTSFFKLGGASYLNILDKLLPVIQDHGYEFEIEDRRARHDFSFQPIGEDYLTDLKWPAGHRFAGQPIELRDYQVEAINTCLDNLQGVNVLPTSAGKTIITATLSKIIEDYGRSIVIVPNKNLVQQTEEDYRNLGLDVGVLFGDRKEYDRTHTICTWQSLNILDKKNKDALDNQQLDKFLKNLVCVICDECHGVKDMNVLHGLMTSVFANIPIRWGLTGTIPEEEYKQMGLITAIGPEIGALTPKELQDKGYLAQCNVTVLQTQEALQYPNYQQEFKYLVTNEDRLRWLAQTIEEIAKTGNTLVLVDRIETGQKLYNQISNSVFVSGEMKANDRRDHYKELNVADNGIMIASFATTSTGISINRVFNLILVEPGKSFVRVIQSIGRGLRKADDKDSVEIYDICSRMKFSNNHLTKRKQFYKKVEYPYTIKKVTV